MAVCLKVSAVRLCAGHLQQEHVCILDVCWWPWEASQQEQFPLREPSRAESAIPSPSQSWYNLFVPQFALR